jgi:hypothetical protein
VVGGLICELRVHVDRIVTHAERVEEVRARQDLAQTCEVPPNTYNVSPAHPTPSWRLLVGSECV